MGKRVFRLLVCLILVCCMIVNLSPIRAHAVAGEGLAAAMAAAGFGAASIPAVIAVVGIIAALGLYAGVNAAQEHQLELQYLAEQCVDSLKAAGTIVGDTVTGWIADGKSYFGEELVEAVRDWLWGSSGVLSSGYPFHSSWSFTFANSSYSISASYPFGIGFVYGTVNGRYYHKLYAVCDKYTQFIYNNSGWNPTMRSTGEYVKFLSEVNSSSVSSYLSSAQAITDCIIISLGDFSSLDEYNTALDSTCLLTSSIATTTDLTMGQVIAPSGTTVRTDYGEIWTITDVEVKIQFEDDGSGDSGDDDGVTIIPLFPVRTTDDDTMLTIDQDTALSGDTTFEPDTSTEDPEGSTTPPTDPGSDTTTPPDDSGDSGDSGTSSGGSGDYTPYVLDLREFFPFCIPFDLYDFFTLLSADPVAPSFHWEIQDLAGNMYAIDIDLSAWDSVASLFRTLQLFLFIVGLAAASRKFIKW